MANGKVIAAIAAAILLSAILVGAYYFTQPQDNQVGKISWLKKESTIPGSNTLRIIDIDANHDSKKPDTVKIYLWSNYGSEPIIRDAVESGESTGIFEHTIELAASEQDLGSNGILAESGSPIKAEYTDYSIPKSLAYSDDMQVRMQASFLASLSSLSSSNSTGTNSSNSTSNSSNSTSNSSNSTSSNSSNSTNNAANTGGSCKIEVAATSIGGLPDAAMVRHLYIIFTDSSGTEFYFRGGPSQSPSPQNGNSYGPIRGDSGRYLPGTVDWDPDAPRVVVMEGPAACAKFALLQNELNRISATNTPYDPLGLNSNSVVRTLLRNCAIPEDKPFRITPGWDDTIR